MTKKSKPHVPQTRILVDEDKLTAVCDNCGHTCPVDDLDEYHDFWSRAEVGCIMPAGDCPKCGAFSYLQDDNAKAMDAGRALLVRLKTIHKAHDRLSEEVENTDSANDAEHNAAVELLGVLMDLYDALRKASTEA